MAPSLQPAYRSRWAQAQGTRITPKITRSMYGVSKERSGSGTAVLTKAHRAFVAGLLTLHPHARLAVFRYPQRIIYPTQI